VFNLTGQRPPDSNNLLSTKYDERSKSLTNYSDDEKIDLSVDNFNHTYDLPVIRTIDIQRYLD
ncbi:unnamed protein product, partial [Rotaria magnacalcarata]